MDKPISVTWRSPANIALIKYWGKHDYQLPNNPSLSMTLNHSITETTIIINPTKKPGNPVINYVFEDQPNLIFEDRVKTFIHYVKEFFTFLSSNDISIKSQNNFPHSSGISSSASFMSSLALCLCSVERKLSDSPMNDYDFYKKASFIARLGSGSATRSVYGGFVNWGLTNLIHDSSDEYATPIMDNIHKVFTGYCDSILIINSGQKKQSSSEGHRLMETNPYNKTKYIEAGRNFGFLLDYLRKGDEKGFGRIVENEAMSLHGMIFISQPWHFLMEPNTIVILDKVREFREINGLPICFTLDAGPNVHILYSRKIKNKIKTFIENELKPFCENHKWIDDSIGNGPVELNP